MFDFNKYDREFVEKAINDGTVFVLKKRYRKMSPLSIMGVLVHEYGIPENRDMLGFAERILRYHECWFDMWEEDYEGGEASIPARTQYPDGGVNSWWVHPAWVAALCTEAVEITPENYEVL